MQCSPIASVAAVLLAACSLAARGEPAAQADTKPAAIAQVTVGSLDQLSAAADDIQVPLPPFLTASGLEQTFAFVDQFRVTTQIQPSPTFTAHESQKPGLPEGCAFRVDWQPPHDWVHDGLEKLAGLGGRDQFFKDAPGGPANPAAFEELIIRCCNAVLDGQTATYAMELLDDGPVFYSVTQAAYPRDVKADFSDLRQRGDRLDNNNKKTTELSSYTLADGTEVSRLVGLSDDGKPAFYVDSVDRGTTRMTTISTTDVRAVARLLGLKPVGPLMDPAAGWIDGKQTLSLIAAAGKMNGALTDEDHELLNKVLGGQRLTWTVNSAEKRLNILFDVPVSLIKNVTQNMDALQKVFAQMNAGR